MDRHCRVISKVDSGVSMPYQFYAALIVGLVIIVIAFLMARWLRLGDQFRHGLGVMAVGLMYMLLLILEASYRNDWDHFVDIFLFFHNV